MRNLLVLIVFWLASGFIDSWSQPIKKGINLGLAFLYDNILEIVEAVETTIN